MATAYSPDRRRIAGLRLSALGIDQPVAPTPEAAVRTALATQAQDFLGTLWSVALRTPDATTADVESAHEAGRFVRSWPMRGTLHFVIGEDLSWMLGLTSARMLQTAAGPRRRLGLTEDEYSRAGSGASIPSVSSHNSGCWFSVRETDGHCSTNGFRSRGGWSGRRRSRSSHSATSPRTGPRP